MRRIVVTGGAGFIGSSVVRKLEQMDVKPVVLDDLSTGLVENVETTSAEVIIGSITDPDALDRAFRDAEAIIHLAARPSVPRSIADPMATHTVNATGTLLALEAARRADCRHFILASSSSVYGASGRLPRREGDVAIPLSPYAASKLAAESYVQAYAGSFGIGGLIFRFFNVYGPRQRADSPYAAVIPAFLNATLSGNPVTVHGDGEQTRDFTFVESVASVLVRAADEGASELIPVNLAFGSRSSLLDVIAAVEVATGRTVTKNHTPPRTGDVRDSQADPTRLLGLFPDEKPVTMEDGLRATVAWMKGQK